MLSLSRSFSKIIIVSEKKSVIQCDTIISQSTLTWNNKNTLSVQHTHAFLLQGK